MKWVPFFFDGNAWFGEVHTPRQLRAAVRGTSSSWGQSEAHVLERVLSCPMAPVADIPPEYRGKQVPVHLPSFGFRREHRDGVIPLDVWAQTHGINLRQVYGPVDSDCVFTVRGLSLFGSLGEGEVSRGPVTFYGDLVSAALAAGGTALVCSLRDDAGYQLGATAEGPAGEALWTWFRGQGSQPVHVKVSALVAREQGEKRLRILSATRIVYPEDLDPVEVPEEVQE